MNRSGSPFIQTEDRRGIFNRTVVGATLHVNWNFDAFSLTSVTDYLRLQKRYGEDSDISPNPLFNYDTFQHYHQLAEELRLNGTVGALKWIGGVYFLDYHTRNDEVVELAPVFGGLTNAPFTLTTQSQSAFGQLEYDFSPNWTGIAGLRYTSDQKTFDYEYFAGSTTPAFVYNPGTEPRGFEDLRQCDGQTRTGLQNRLGIHAVCQHQPRRKGRRLVCAQQRCHANVDRQSAVQAGNSHQLRTRREADVLGRPRAPQRRGVLLRLSGLPGIFPRGADTGGAERRCHRQGRGAGTGRGAGAWAESGARYLSFGDCRQGRAAARGRLREYRTAAGAEQYVTRRLPQVKMYCCCIDSNTTFRIGQKAAGLFLNMVKCFTSDVEGIRAGEISYGADLRSRIEKYFKELKLVQIFPYAYRFHNPRKMVDVTIECGFHDITDNFEYKFKKYEMHVRSSWYGNCRCCSIGSPSCRLFFK